MTEDVSTTKRKKLTLKQRLAMFEAHKGVCVLCTTKIRDKRWIDEHIIPLALGGSNDMENRGPAHKACAAAKTNGKDGDLARAAKAKRQKVAKVIGKPAPSKTIESAPFPVFEKKHRAYAPIEKLAGLGRRRMFE